MKKPALKRPVKWLTFVSPDGDEWSVYLSTRKVSKCLRGDSEDGPNFGICFFNTRRIYLDVEQTTKDLRDVLLHEILHVSMRRIPIPDSWEEQIVHEITPRLLHVLSGIKMRFPPIPPEVLPLLKVEAPAA